MLIVQGARMAWASPYVKQAVATIVFEQVMPVAANAANERVIPVVKTTAKEKVIPAVKDVMRKTRAGLSNLKRHTVNKGFSKSPEMFVVTERKNEDSAGCLVSISKASGEEFLQTWLPG